MELLLAKSHEEAHSQLPSEFTKDELEVPLEESEEDSTVTQDVVSAPTPLSDGEKFALEAADLEDDSSGNSVQDTTNQAPQKPIQSVVHYRAEKSIFFDVKNKTVRLYGEGAIEYDNIKLEAEEVFLDWTNHIVTAFSKKNEAGDVEKKAVFTRDGVEYIAESVRYNFDSKRGVADNLFTKQEDGILRSGRMKQDREDTFYADKGIYTTCNLTKPHFHIEAQTLKMTQDDKVVSGPFRLYFDDVPIPVGFVGGIFYFAKNSGIIFPQYGGETTGKGFWLKEGGYYIKFNDYIDLALKGDIYSKGAVAFTAESRYKQRYQYNGDLSYTRNTHTGILTSKVADKTRSWRFKWNHRTENNRTSSLTSKIDLRGTSSGTKDALPIEEGLQTRITSQVRYTNKLVGLPYTLNANLGYTQDFRRNNREETATIPDIALGTGNIYPFRKKGKAGDSWYANIYCQHKVRAANRVSNKVNDNILDFSPKNWGVLLRNGNYGVINTVPIGTNIKILRYLNLTPSFEYRMRWYGEKLNYTHQDDKKGTKVKGFEYVSDYDFRARLATTLYGTYNFGRNAAIQTIRHQIDPTIRFTYVPDFSAPEYDYWQTMQDGTKLNRFRDATYGGPTSRAQAVMNIYLDNRLEMKVKSIEDGEKITKKVPVLKGFNWRTSYDFLADNFPLEDIHLHTYTSLFNNLFDVNFSSTFDPYIYRNQDSIQHEVEKINEFAWQHGQGLGRIKEASISIGTKFSPGDKDKVSKWYDELDEEEQEEVKEEVKHIQEHPEQYVDFSIPWSLQVGYTWSYVSPLHKKNNIKEDNIYVYSSPSKKGKNITQVLSFDGDLNLTTNWKVIFSSSYDITEQKMSDYTKIGIERDLHCWKMEFGWQPFGDSQHFEFSIGVRAPVLQALRYSRNKSYRNF